MLTQLFHFIAIVDHGGLTNASRQINISQPALTRSLQALEFRLDTQLIQRGKGRLELTAAGQLLLDRARTLLVEQRSLISDLAALKQNVGPIVHINTSPMIAISLLSRVIVRAAEHYPDLRISVRGDNGTNYEWKKAALRSGEIDVLVSISTTFEAHESIVQQTLLRPRLTVVAPPERRLSGATQLSELMDERWILPAFGTSGRIIVDNEFSVRNLPTPRHCTEISDWRTALEVVRAGQGITVIPYHAACFGPMHGLEMLSVKFALTPPEMTVMYRKATLERVAPRRFVELINAIVAEDDALEGGGAVARARSRRG